MSALRRFKSVLVLVAAAFGVAAMPAAADIYSFKDEKGVVHFTNISGLDKRYKLVRKESPSAGLPVSDSLVPARVFMPAQEDIQKYSAIINTAAKAYGVDASLVHAVISAESGYNPYALSRTGAERVRVHGQGLAQLALGEDLDGDVRARGQAAGAKQLERDLGAGLEALLERGDVDRLGAGTEGLERHRLLHVRPAQLSHAHVDRHLATLEARPALAARAGAGALLPAPGRLAGARALAAPHALARAAASRGGRQAVQPDALVRAGRPLGRRAHLPSSTSTRWRTARSMPRACSLSVISTV